MYSLERIVGAVAVCALAACGGIAPGSPSDTQLPLDSGADGTGEVRDAQMTEAESGAIWELPQATDACGRRPLYGDVVGAGVTTHLHALEVYHEETLGTGVQWLRFQPVVTEAVRDTREVGVELHVAFEGVYSARAYESSALMGDTRLEVKASGIGDDETWVAKPGRDAIRLVLWKVGKASSNAPIRPVTDTVGWLRAELRSERGGAPLSVCLNFFQTVP